MTLKLVIEFFYFVVIVVWSWDVCLYYCDVERDCLQADCDEPAGDWATFRESVHDILVNKKSNAMLVFTLFSTEENLVSFLCCCFAKVLPSHFTESKDVLSLPVFNLRILCEKYLQHQQDLYHVFIDFKIAFEGFGMQLCGQPWRNSTLARTVCLYYCDVERDCLQADCDEPAGDWLTFLGSVHNILVNKKSNTMLVFILFSTEENLVSFLCCFFAKVHQSHFTESKDVPSISVHFVC